MHKSHWLLPVALLLAACGTEDTSVRPAANRKPNYFDVKGLLDTQIAELNRRQPVVEKQVRLRDGKVETTRVIKTDWSKELQVFYQADINKPALRGLYAPDVPPKVRNGVTRNTYALNHNSDAPVKRLTVESAWKHGTTEHLTATVKQDNPLFYSEKKLVLTMVDKQLTAYEVQGVQKLVMFDTVRYSVVTRVLD